MCLLHLQHLSCEGPGPSPTWTECCLVCCLLCADNEKGQCKLLRPWASLHLAVGSWVVDFMDWYYVYVMRRQQVSDFQTWHQMYVDMTCVSMALQDLQKTSGAPSFKTYTAYTWTNVQIMQPWATVAICDNIWFLWCRSTSYGYVLTVLVCCQNSMLQTV